MIQVQELATHLFVAEALGINASMAGHLFAVPRIVEQAADSSGQTSVVILVEIDRIRPGGFFEERPCGADDGCAAGQRLGKAQKGVNIIGGKKILK